MAWSDRYKDPDDPTRKFVSVTTVQKVLDKPALKYWAVKKTAERAVLQAAELSTIQRLEGDEAAIKWLKQAHREASTSAAMRGSDLHNLAERRFNGEELPPRLTPDVRGMVDSMARFIVYHDVTFVSSEMKVLSRKHGYAGTADGLANIPAYGELPVILDWKTGSGPYGDWGHQLAAYSGADTELSQTASESHARAMTEHRPDLAVAVMLSPDAYRLIEYRNLDARLDEFLHCLAIYQSPDTGLFHEVRIWREEVRAATSIQRLRNIWRAADAAGEWTDDLNEQAAARKLELKGD